MQAAVRPPSTTASGPGTARQGGPSSAILPRSGLVQQLLSVAVRLFVPCRLLSELPDSTGTALTVERMIPAHDHLNKLLGD